MIISLIYSYMSTYTILGRMHRNNLSYLWLRLFQRFFCTFEHEAELLSNSMMTQIYILRIIITKEWDCTKRRVIRMVCRKPLTGLHLHKLYLIVISRSLCKNVDSFYIFILWTSNPFLYYVYYATISKVSHNNFG